MADDFKNLTDYKHSISGTGKAPLAQKKVGRDLDSNRVHVIITQKKQNSWVEDLDEREKLRKLQRVFH